MVRSISVFFEKIGLENVTKRLEKDRAVDPKSGYSGTALSIPKNYNGINGFSLHDI